MRKVFSVHNDSGRSFVRQRRYSVRRVKYWLLRAVIVLLCVSVFFQPLVHFPYFEKRTMPEKKAIDAILEKSQLNSSDYQVLFGQTGLGKPAIDQLRARKGYTKEDILVYQDFFLEELETKCQPASLFTKQDLILSDEKEKVPMAPLEDGDIILSFSSHSLGWKHGHAGLVVDAEQGLCLEAVMPGSVSKIKSTDHWRTYSSFLILRLKTADRQERQSIAAYAYENLVNVPYSLTSGLIGRKKPRNSDNLKAQCAYLIWYAFIRFGYDLDSDGGKLVTVEDLKESPELQVIQAFGMKLS